MLLVTSSIFWLSIVSGGVKFNISQIYKQHNNIASKWIRQSKVLCSSKNFLKFNWCQNGPNSEKVFKMI